MITLTGARLFDGAEMRPGRWTVAIDGDRIASVGETGTIEAAGAIDLGGMTLMPGLVTSHYHADFSQFDLATGMMGIPLGKEVPPGVGMVMGVRNTRLLLESGFTGYIGAGCANDVDAQLKVAFDLGIMPGPRLIACGHHVNTEGDANTPTRWWQDYATPGIDVFGSGPNDLRRLVRDEIRRGVEIIKIFGSPGHLIPGHHGPANLADDELAAIVGAAHQRGALVRSHVCGKAQILQAIAHGVDIVDHGDEVDEEVIARMAEAGTYWVPSLAHTRMMLDLGFDPEGEFADAWQRLPRLLPIAHAAGVRILVGDDYSGLFGKIAPDNPLQHKLGAYANELPLYGAMEGVDPQAVLSWATRNPGLLLGRRDKGGVGTVAAGALADLIVVDGDPVADLSLLARPEQVLKAVICGGGLFIDRLPRASRKLAA